MLTKPYALLNELVLTPLDDESCNSCPKIRVRVTRLREVYTPDKKHIMFCVAMVLVDEKGNYIYAEIKPAVWSYFHEEIIDGKIHIMRRFKIIPNKKKYRVVGDCPIMIDFIYDTYIKSIEERDPIIPIHRFEFLKFGNLEQRRLEEDVTLTDLIGVFIVDHTKPNYFAVEIEDEEKKRIRVALWDDCITDFKNQKDKLGKSTEPFIVTLTSLRVKTYNGYSSVSTSSASRIYINLDIPEVTELKALLSGKVLTLTEPVASNAISTINISSLLEHCKSNYKEDMIFYCMAEVNAIVAENPWHYPSCTTCPTRPQYDNKAFYCHRCKKIVEIQTIRYRIDLKVKDDSGAAIFVVFDDDARKLIGQDAVSLYDESKSQKEEDNEDSSRIPKILFNTFVGKKFRFKIRIKDFNHNATNKSRFGIIDILDETENADVQTSMNSTLAPKRDHSDAELDLDEEIPIGHLSKKAKSDVSLTKAKSKSKAENSKSQTRKFKGVAS